MSRIKDPDAPATGRQTFALFVITGYDVRACGLSKQDAHDLMEMHDAGENVTPLVSEMEGAIQKRPDPKPPMKQTGSNGHVPKAAIPPKEKVVVLREEKKPRRKEPHPVRMRRIDRQEERRSTRVFTVPGAIAQEYADDTWFLPVNTPEGILYKPMEAR